MRWSYNLERSRVTAVWLSGVALLVFVMVVVGGATRLTGSGLSITQWKPISGVIPPMSAHGWAAEFANYQRIPQYRFINQGMSLGAFKSLFWWEWAHRLLGRLVGAAILIPLIVLLYLRRIPRRLIWRCGVILVLVAVEGAVGWWMVASGLETRVYVAPERLATHLLLALLIFSVCLWTALEAWCGRSRAAFGPSQRWVIGSMGLVGLTFLQIMLGALVAGNKAGQIYTDWPMMAGKLIPSDYAPKGSGLWNTLAHTQAAVQFNHRLTGYLLFLSAVAFAILIWRTPRGLRAVKRLALLFAGVVTAQALMGIWTLKMAAPLDLSLSHQMGAVIVLASAIALAWRVRRN